MQKFLTNAGRYGHLALQACLLIAQVYVAYLNGGKVSAVNAVIGLAQAGLADQAYVTPAAAPKDPSEPKP